MRPRIDTDSKPWNAGGLRCLVALFLLAPVLGSCAGPQPLSVAIIPRDHAEYLTFANEANLNGRLAFANWMSKERGLSPHAVLSADAYVSSTRNPFDAYHDRQAVSRGAVIYAIHCLRCHGHDARGHGPATLEGHPANDFKSFGSRFAATLHRGAPRKWFRVIRDGAGEVVEYPDGRMTAMPPFKSNLANEQIWQVISYLQSLDVYAAKETPEGDE